MKATQNKTIESVCETLKKTKRKQCFGWFSGPNDSRCAIAVLAEEMFGYKTKCNGLFDERADFSIRSSGGEVSPFMVLDDIKDNLSLIIKRMNDEEKLSFSQIAEKLKQLYT
jgi:hypothetical protein